MNTPTHHRAVALVLCTVLGIGLTQAFSRRIPNSANESVIQPADAATSHAPAPVHPVPVDPNLADMSALERLPRIGPAVARRIFEARMRGAVFHSPSDLERIRGIGPRTVELLTPWLVFPDGGALPTSSSRSESQALR